MIDVARLAGVSHQTVSRVLNSSPAVGPELTLRVQEAIQLLGYKRNSAARALASRRSLNLGVISFGISLYGPSLTLFGIAEAAREVGYTTSLITLANFKRETVEAAFDHLEEVSVDGVVVLAPVKGAMDTIRALSDDLPLVTSSRASLTSRLASPSTRSWAHASRPATCSASATTRCGT